MGSSDERRTKVNVRAVFCIGEIGTCGYCRTRLPRHQSVKERALDDTSASVALQSSNLMWFMLPGLEQQSRCALCKSREKGVGDERRVNDSDQQGRFRSEKNRKNI